MIIKILRMLGGAVGIALIALGVGRVLFSTATIPAGGAVNASLDTEIRADGVLLIVFGCAYVWAVQHWPIPTALLRFLAASMALLAVARLISMIDAGVPHWIFMTSAGVELMAAVLTYWYSTMRKQGQPGQERGLTPG
ncbi:DUF4345 domain-containing protein [Mycobacterium syngnathidarum]